MNRIAALGLSAALFALPAGAFACGACGNKVVHQPARQAYIPAAQYAASYAPAPAYGPAPCAPAPVACAPACPQPCFNPLSIVGGVVSGVGNAIGSVGSGIAGAFGSCNPCY